MLFRSHVMSNCFSFCSICKQCCGLGSGKANKNAHDDVELSSLEQRRLRRTSIGCLNDKTIQCELCGDTGCTLSAKDRPIVCRIYPLIYYRTRITIDFRCPLATQYIMSLATEKDGWASKHLGKAQRDLSVLIRQKDPVLAAMDSNNAWVEREVNKIWLCKTKTF